MANVPKCFSNKRDNRHFVQREFLADRICRGNLVHIQLKTVLLIPH
jgi:hypothetical protein